MGICVYLFFVRKLCILNWFFIIFLKFFRNEEREKRFIFYYVNIFVVVVYRKKGKRIYIYIRINNELVMVGK